MVKTSRRRYIVIHVLSPPEVGKGLLIKLTRDVTRGLTREEFEMVKPWFVYYQNGWAIIRTTHEGTQRMISIIESLHGKELREGILGLRTVGVSGTLRSAFFKHIPQKARNGHHYREQR